MFGIVGAITAWLTCLAPTAELEWIKVSADRAGFVLERSGKAFVPWGFNYDHDEAGTLIEDYWNDDWPRIESDFKEMKDLGANVVRIHIQLNKFLDGPNEGNAKSLERLKKLLKLAEDVGLYIDLTGLGCYHKKDVPAWYDKLDEAARWNAQKKFWSIVAEACKDSAAIFCYDLMNEPVVPGGKRQGNDWLGGAFAGKHFVQFITLDQADRPRPEIARKWIHELVEAVRTQDKRHLITVGMVDWSLDRPGLTSGFVPSKVAEELDFLCVHIYPERGKVDDALKTLQGFAIGKPVVIEEIFPLKCTGEEFSKFLSDSRANAAGWIGFYWGTTLEELRASKTISAAIVAAWLDRFKKGPPTGR